MQIWVPSLGWEDPLENKMEAHSSILAWEIPWTEEPWGHKESDKTEQLNNKFCVYHKKKKKILALSLVGNVLLNIFYW